MAAPVKPVTGGNSDCDHSSAEGSRYDASSVASTTLASSRSTAATESQARRRSSGIYLAEDEMSLAELGDTSPKVDSRDDEELDKPAVTMLEYAPQRPSSLESSPRRSRFTGVRDSWKRLTKPTAGYGTDGDPLAMGTIALQEPKGPRRTMRQWFAWQKVEHTDCIKETWTNFWGYIKAMDKKSFLKKAFARRWWGWWALLIVIVACSVTLSRFHDPIIEAIHPIASAVFHTKWSWIIPVILLIVVSIPPLIGHEIIILIVGVIWGVWYGFLIAIAGTFLGEILCYYLMKHGLRKHAAKFEEKSRLYAGLANIMRRDGLWMIILVRFSAIPGHITTAIQSTIGISVWIFGIAAAVSLPKQLALVYLGVVFGERTAPHDADPAWLARYNYLVNKNRIITWTLFVFTTVLTFVAAYVIWFRMWQVWKEKDAQERAAKLAATTSSLSVSPTFTIDKEAMAEEERFAAGSTYAYTLPAFPGLEADYGRSPPTYSQNGDALRQVRSSLADARPGMGARTRSGTLVSLALNNNSLPYLPYTPMSAVPSQLPNNARADMPSNVPTAVIPGTHDDTSSMTDERPYTPSGQSPQSPRFGQSPFSSAATDRDSGARVRRVRLNGSNSNLSLPAIQTRPLSTNSSNSTELIELSPQSSKSPRFKIASAQDQRPRSRSRSGTLVIGNLPAYQHTIDSAKQLVAGSPLRASSVNEDYFDASSEVVERPSTDSTASRSARAGHKRSKSDIAASNF